jgi:flagellar basal body-associated protein FliL
MAIVVEEEKKPVNWVAILTTIIIIVVVFIGAYFLFFKKPELIEVVAPGNLQGVSQISRVSFDPESVLGAPTFKLLRQYGTAPDPPNPGRNNPFRPF